MPLTVLKNTSASTPEQLIRLFHQSQLEWARHLGDETELDYGRWIADPANCLLDAYLLPDQKPSDLIADMNRRSPTWQCCSLNPSMPDDRTAPLAAALLAEGWVSQPTNILYRRRPASQTVSTSPVLKIIPARASFRHYRELLDQRSPGDADTALLHLDDSHFDALLALKDGHPVGSIGILTSGEVGTVREWFVHPDHRSHGIGRLLLDRAMEICTRSILRHVMIGLPDPNHPATPLCQAFGFEPLGIWASFWKDSCKSGRLFA
jgi:GNAT superfamily N-acetyltransferase